jgi:hypothetical protein
MFNVTTSGNVTLEDFLPTMPKSWDGWVWFGLDAVFSTIGWLIFGRSWDQVRSGFSLVIRVGALLLVCISLHYLLALCPLLAYYVAAGWNHCHGGVGHQKFDPVLWEDGLLFPAMEWWGTRSCWSKIHRARAG